MKKLNRKKPFGSVHGSGVIKFEQDGAFFNASGAEIVDGEVVQDQETQPPAEPSKKGGKGSKKSDAAEAEIVDGEVVQDQETQPPAEPSKKGGKGSKKSDAAEAEIDSQLSAQADLDGAK